MLYTETKIRDFKIRFGEKSDAALIVKYIRDLASFEGELEYVSVTPQTLEKYMFEAHGAEALIGEYKGNPIGFAFFHSSFSTFLGKPGIALVDLYIEPDMRGNGFGKMMLSRLASIALQRGGSRLEWWVHDWNTEAAERYLNWGAHKIHNTRVYRMDGGILDSFSQHYRK